MATPEELKSIAQQLQRPHGEKGLEMATMMNETNKAMTQQAIKQLKLSSGEKVLELGHGNGGHLPYLLQQAADIQYFGLELSPLMQQVAAKANQDYVEQQRASFHLYDGTRPPFEDEQFDKIFSVNTVYFWPEPSGLIAELYRVLKKEGVLALTIAHKSFMELLPFTAFGFHLYEPEELKTLVLAQSFQFLSTETATEIVTSKTGEKVERQFSTLTFSK